MTTLSHDEQVVATEMFFKTHDDTARINGEEFARVCAALQVRALAQWFIARVSRGDAYAIFQSVADAIATSAIDEIVTPTPADRLDRRAA